MRPSDEDFERAVDISLSMLRGKIGNARDEAEALLTYGQLSADLGDHGLDIPPFGEPMSSILEAVSTREANEGRGLISAAVVVAETHRPGRGFFRLARRAPHLRVGDDDAIWFGEMRRLVAEARGERGRRITAHELGAWMIKCTPSVWDIARYMADGNDTIDSWSVVRNYRSAMMGASQPVLFWVTGREGATPEPGLWGQGIATGSVVEHRPGRDRGYWTAEEQRQRSHLFAPVDIQLMDAPVSRRRIQADPRLAGLEVLRQPQMGNPLFVSKAELAALADLLASDAVGSSIAANGQGFGSLETRSAVEHAAMAEVTRYYEQAGWDVHDVSDQNLGWDLTCTSAQGDVHDVEVKGVTGLIPTVFLTRNEATAAANRPDWRLAVVTAARSAPVVTVWNGVEAMAVASPFLYQLRLPTGDM